MFDIRFGGKVWCKDIQICPLAKCPKARKHQWVLRIVIRLLCKECRKTFPDRIV